DAARAQGDPARRPDHVHLRDPRPGRGADDERPARGVQPRADRAARLAGGDVRAPGDGVRGRLRRDLEPAPRRCVQGARRRGRAVHGSAGEDPHRRARCGGGRRRGRGRWHHPQRRVPGAGHALHRGARRRLGADGHATEPAHIVHGGAGRAGSTRAAGLGATAHAPRPGVTSGLSSRGGGMFQRRLGGVVAVIALITAACGPGGSPAPTGGGGTPPTAGATGGASPAASLDMPTGIGDGEGALDLVIWAGYAERGASDPAYDWVTPFETATGCKVTTQDMTDSNNGVSLMQSGNYDGISASGDATTRLIQGGIVAPVNVDLLSNWPNVFPGLKGLPHNTVNGVPYGVPHGRGPNLLGYNTTVV